jgi:hypothetical protein
MSRNYAVVRLFVRLCAATLELTSDEKQRSRDEITRNEIRKLFERFKFERASAGRVGGGGRGHANRQIYREYINNDD